MVILPSGDCGAEEEQNVATYAERDTIGVHQGVAVDMNDEGSDEECSSSSSSSQEGFDDEKRHAAEIIKQCFMSVAQSSVNKAKSAHGIEDWWKKGSIAASKEENGNENNISGSEKVEDQQPDEKLEWVSVGVMGARGVSETLKEIRSNADKQLTKKLGEQRKQQTGHPTLVEKKQLKKGTNKTQWMGTPSIEITEDVKRDLAVLRMRDTLDPKRFYKSADSKKEPDWLQIGTVIDNPYEGKAGRLPNRLRKRTIAEQWLADPELKEMRQKRMKNIEDMRKQERTVCFKNFPYLKAAKKRLKG